MTFAGVRDMAGQVNAVADVQAHRLSPDRLALRLLAQDHQLPVGRHFGSAART